MIKIKNIFRRKQKIQTVFVTIGNICPKCKDDSLFFTSDSYYLCENCFSQLSIEQVKNFNLKKQRKEKLKILNF